MSLRLLCVKLISLECKPIFVWSFNEFSFQNGNGQLYSKSSWTILIGIFFLCQVILRNEVMASCCCRIEIKFSYFPCAGIVLSQWDIFSLWFFRFFYRKNKSQQANLLSALIHFHFDRSFYSVFADAVNFFYFWRHKFMIVQFYSLKCQNRKSNQAQSLLKLVVIIRQWFFLHSLEFISIFLISIQHESSCEWKKATLVCSISRKL